MSTGIGGLRKTLFWACLEKLQRAILIVCSLSVVGIIFLAVIKRYIFETDLYGMEEVIVIVAFWLYFIGGSHGSYEKSHIKADLVSVYISNEKLKKTLMLFASLIEAGISIILAIWAFGFFTWGIEKGAQSPGLGIPLVVSQSAVFFGLVLMAFYGLYYFIEDAVLFKQNLYQDKEEH